MRETSRSGEKKRLKVELSGLAEAFENASWEHHYFLDLETGQVVMLPDEVLRYAEEPPDYPLPDWQRDWVKQAEVVEAGYGSRYIAVPKVDSHEAYDDMEDFMITINDEQLHQRLWSAIRGRGAFRRFKEVLAAHPHERERWFDFKNKRLHQRIMDWLESEGIELIIEEPEKPPGQEPDLPANRRLLLAETLAFVREVIRMLGVKRVALLGSLTTDKADPKDTDLLVTVTDEMDLIPLAADARRLQGHLQGHNLGADVFLADLNDTYLGRSCPWKRCGPGIRASCDAWHCGQRLYLHDDWGDVRLDEKTVRQPPLILWPQLIARVSVPADVEQELIQPLLDEGITAAQ